MLCFIYEQVLETIFDSADTGNIGNSNIFVTVMVEVITIPTGERGEDAI